MIVPVAFLAAIYSCTSVKGQVFSSSAKQYSGTTINIDSSDYWFMGYAGCSECTMIENNTALTTVRCRGSMSCAGSSLTTVSIDTDPDTTYGIGEAICEGYYSCAQSTMNTIIVIDCNGDKSCSNSDITFKNNNENGGTGIMRCNGLNSCIYSNINGEIDEIYGAGFLDFYGSEIVSDSDYIRANFSGMLSGYNLTINCSSNQTCEIICASIHSCYGLQVNCDEDSTCIVNCNDTYFCPNGYNTRMLFVTSILALNQTKKNKKTKKWIDYRTKQHFYIKTPTIFNRIQYRF